MRSAASASESPSRARRCHVSPGGFDRYFTEVAPLLSVDGPPDFEALGALQARYRVTMDPESIGPLSERFGLRP